MILMPTTEELKKLSYKELIAERDSILRYINDFERDFNMKNLVWGCKPSPDVHYQVYLDYLGELCPIISEKFNSEYEFGSKTIFDYYEEMKESNKSTTTIVSFNINNYTKEKIETLFQYNSDIYIVPEITWESEVILKKGYEMLWSGDSKGERFPKGLGIIWKKGNARIPAWYNECLRFAIPLLYKDFLIIGIWPTKDKEKKNESYLKISNEILQYYAPYFTEKTIITGDFNLFYREGAKSNEASFLPINEMLESLGFKSVYHSIKKEDFGKETAATYYHQFKAEQPFFLDYTYSNFPVKNYELLPWNKNMSDHVGQIIEI